MCADWFQNLQSCDCHVLPFLSLQSGSVSLWLPVSFHYNILGLWVAGSWSFWFIDLWTKASQFSLLPDEENSRHHTAILDFELEPVSGWNFGLLPYRWAGSTSRVGVGRLTIWWPEGQARVDYCVGYRCPSPLKSVLAMQLTLANEMWVKVTRHSRQKLYPLVCTLPHFLAEMTTTASSVPDRRGSRSLGPGRKKICFQATANVPHAGSVSGK